ncbi:unnamed protein product [Caenorhabditis brenneri]
MRQHEYSYPGLFSMSGRNNRRMAPINQSQRFVIHGKLLEPESKPLQRARSQCDSTNTLIQVYLASEETIRKTSTAHRKKKRKNANSTDSTYECISNAKKTKNES